MPMEGMTDCGQRNSDNNYPMQVALVATLGAKHDCTDTSRDNNNPEQIAIACSVDTTACCMEGGRGHPIQECFLTRKSSYTLQL